MSSIRTDARVSRLRAHPRLVWTALKSRGRLGCDGRILTVTVCIIVVIIADHTLVAQVERLHRTVGKRPDVVYMQAYQWAHVREINIYL